MSQRQASGTGLADETRRVRAVDRTVGLLEALGDAGAAGARLGELAGVTELSEATTLRYLTSLAEGGFVQYDERARTYRLGVGLIVLVERALRPDDVRRFARPYMESLRHDYLETVNLASVVNGRIVLVDALEGVRPIRKGAQVGEIDFMHASAVGKALLAFTPAAERAELLAGVELEALTERTLVTVEALERDLEEVRARGYAIDDEEGVVGLRCVAAPIYGRDGHVVSAISISAPSTSMPLEQLPEAGERVARDALAISEAMGFVAAAPAGEPHV